MKTVILRRMRLNAIVANATAHLLCEPGGDTGSAPRADRQANGAALVLDEIADALVKIDVPLGFTPHQLLFRADRIDWTHIGAQPATGAEIVSAEDILSISDQRHIGHDTSEPERRSVLAVDH